MGRHQITATIKDKSGNVLSCAQNNYDKSHPIQARFAGLSNQPDRIYLHAEIAALVKLGKHAKPHSIHVSRNYKNGKPALAKPCAVCQAAIKHWGIKHTYFTESERTAPSD